MRSREEEDEKEAANFILSCNSFMFWSHSHILWLNSTIWKHFIYSHSIERMINFENLNFKPVIFSEPKKQEI